MRDINGVTVETTASEEVVRVMNEFTSDSDNPTPIQNTLLGAIERRLAQEFDEPETEEQADTLSLAAVCGVGAVLDVLRLANDGAIFSGETMDSLSREDQLGILLHSMTGLVGAFGEDPEDDDVDFEFEDFEDADIGSVLSLLSEVFGGGEEEQIGADSR